MMSVHRSKGKRIVCFLFLFLITTAMCSCGKSDEPHFRNLMSVQSMSSLEIDISDSPSGDINWCAVYWKTSDGTENGSEEKIAPFDKKDYDFLSKMEGLDFFYPCWSDSVPAETVNRLLGHLPQAHYIGLAYCPNADFSVLKSHGHFEELVFSNHCDLTTLPVLDTRVLGLSGCDNIPWDIVRQMDTVEVIRYGGKKLLGPEVFDQLCKMKSLQTLVYNAVPYESWNWDEAMPPYKITSVDEAGEWVFDTISRETISHFLDGGNRTLVLLAYNPTNPGAD